MAFNNKKILITGGLGFIGSNLALKLVHLGANLTIVDSLIPEYGGLLHNVKDIQNKVHINFSDIRDPHSMRYLVQNHDYLFNLAGQTSHMDSMADPQTDLAINCQSQLSLLEACRFYNPKIKIIFASTRQIYGKPLYLPVDEKHLLRPTDVNGINKMAGEWYHILYNNVYGIRACALRLTNTYGPRMRVKDARQTFLGIWIKNVIQGKVFEVWGGEQLRDFTYVDDCVEAMLLAAVNENSNGKVYNIGGKPIISLKNLADLLIELNGNGQYHINNFPEDRKKIDIGDYYSDFSLIQSDLGWEPKISLEKGLIQTLKYYNKELSAYI